MTSKDMVNSSQVI